MNPLRWRRRLLLLGTLPAILVMVLILSLTTWSHVVEQNQRFEASARQLTSQLAAGADYALLSNQPGLLDGAVRRFLEYPGVVSLTITDHSGALWLQRKSALTVMPEDVKRYEADILQPLALPAEDDWFDGATAPAQERIGRVSVGFDGGLILRTELGLIFRAVLLGIAVLLLIGALVWGQGARYAEQLSRQQKAARQLGVIEDLQQQLREREQRWQQLLSQQAAWGKWSHDIRTPLHGVSGMLELLASTPLDDEQQHYVAQARDAAQAMESGLRGMPQPLAGRSPALDGRALAEAERLWVGKRILVVEDDLISQQLLKSIMLPWRVDLTCVDSGKAALGYVGEPWDLVMVDGELPDMNAAGFAVRWQQLRQQARRANSACALVAMTAHSDPLRVAEYQAAGLEPVLIKPLRRQHLLGVLTPLIA